MVVGLAVKAVMTGSVAAGAFTVRVKLVLAVRDPPSVTVMVTLDEPVWLATGVNVTVL